MSQKIPALEQVIGLTLLGLSGGRGRVRGGGGGISSCEPGGELMRLRLVGGCCLVVAPPSHPVIPAQPSQPMIALVSDELGMPQN